MQLEEKRIVSSSSCSDGSLTELNAVYFYDQNQEVILKNKAGQELKGKELETYSLTTRTWISK